METTKTVRLGILAILVVFLAGVVGLLAAGAGSGTAETDPQLGATATDTVEPEPLPVSVKDTRPVAFSFHDSITEYYESARVGIDLQGGVVVSYTSSTSNPDELRDEVERIVLEYVDHINNRSQATHLTVAVNGVQFIVPQPPVEQHVAGTFTDEALLETIEVMESGRN